MERSSFFIKNKAMFGGSPTQEEVDELEKEGVVCFVDLTNKQEKESNKVTPYVTTKEYINYEIQDRYIPIDWPSYARFIIRITSIIKGLNNNEKIYIQCRAGHGRSGIVVASLICHIFSLHPREALTYTNYCHNKRSIMKEKWRKIGSPQTYLQKNFVYKFFEYLNVSHHKNIKYGFNHITKHNIDTRELNINSEKKIFSNIEDAFFELKDKTEIEMHILLRKILRIKIEQNNEFKEQLLKTGLRPIIFHSKMNKKYNNFFSHIITDVRNNIYEVNLKT
jgi:protein-tyrosine phosphatase